MTLQTITRRALQAALAGALVAGTSLSLFSTTAFAAKHRSDPVCRLAATTVGAPLVLTSSGYTPGANYGALFFWPGETVGGTGTTADDGPLTSSGPLWRLGYGSSCARRLPARFS